jgi:hypothetical protein
MSDFHEAWSDIQRRLSPGMEIRNWSREGYTERLSRIEYKDHREVGVSGENTASVRYISKQEFERVFEDWERYKQGHVSRDQINSQNTTYIFSIFHWLEEQPDER